MVRKKVSILAIDDESTILRLLKSTLETEGYRVFTASDGKVGLEIFDREVPSLVILDITMPGLDGYTVCRRIREFSQVPVIMVTARGNEEEKITGFECGADDYMTKPFSVREFVARVKAVLRRNQFGDAIVSQPIFRSRDLEIDFDRRSVTIAGNMVNLTPTEYNLLQELVLKRGKALTYSYLLQKVWGPEYLNETEYLHVFIGRLRSKLHLDSRDQKYIITLSGVGYQFRETGQANI
jgi:DNA-binding response OmpR family regulator